MKTVCVWHWQLECTFLGVKLTVQVQANSSIQIHSFLADVFVYDSVYQSDTLDKLYNALESKAVKFSLDPAYLHI